MEEHKVELPEMAVGVEGITVVVTLCVLIALLPQPLLETILIVPPVLLVITVILSPVLVPDHVAGIVQV